LYGVCGEYGAVLGLGVRGEFKGRELGVDLVVSGSFSFVYFLFIETLFELTLVWMFTGIYLRCNVLFMKSCPISVHVVYRGLERY